jgi:hypothetical protein
MRCYFSGCSQQPEFEVGYFAPHGETFVRACQQHYQAARGEMARTQTKLTGSKLEDRWVNPLVDEDEPEDRGPQTSGTPG